MKRRNFLKAICASPLALLVKKPKRRSGTHYIGPAVVGQEMPEGWVWDGEKFVELKEYRCSCGCGELHYSSTGKQPTLVNTTGTSSNKGSYYYHLEHDFLSLSPTNWRSVSKV
jgi:hypothetical protein